MNSLWQRVRAYFIAVWEVWSGFWFSASDPATLCLIRVLTGGMLLYTHAIWTIDLQGFFGPRGWLPLDFYAIERGYGDDTITPGFMWSIFQHVGSTWLLWMIHIVALLVFLMFFLGLFTRVVAPLAAFFALSYVQRVTPGAFFGLDKINCFLTLYLMLGPCGARYSLDRLWRMQRGDDAEPTPSVSANLAIRLMQWHLCIVYLFSGLGKLQGESWWDGSATWMSVSHLEYQSLDATFLAHYPGAMNLLSHVTVLWELFYCALIWNRWLRPWMLLIAVGVHGFIALCLGMITFGTMMLVANLAFLAPATVRSVVDPLARRVSLALVGPGDGAGQGTAPPTKVAKTA